MRYKFLTLLLLLFFKAILMVRGEVKDNLLQKEANIAIVAVGSMPKVRYNGNKIDLNKVDSQAPVLFKVKGKDDKWSFIKGGMNRLGGFSRVPSSRSLQVECLRNPETEEWRHYTTIPALDDGSRNVIVFMANGTGDHQWDKPRVKLLNLDELGSLKDAFVLNFSSVNLFVKVDGKRLRVKADKILGLDTEGEEVKATDVEVYDVKKSENCLIRTTIPILRKRLNLLIFYDADPKTNRGRKLGFFRAGTPIPRKIEWDVRGNEISLAGFEHQDN